MTSIRVHHQILPEHIDEVVKIDTFWFGKEPTETQFDWAYNFPWLYTILTKNQTVEGYALIIPINGFAHEALKTGEMGEDELKGRYICSFETCSGLYLASVATRLQTNRDIRRQLVGLAQGQVLRPTKETFAFTVSQSGENIACEIGMVCLGSNSAKFEGLFGYTPKLFVKKPFSYTN